ncbi:MAG: PIN domain-containing protein [Spirochaetes bacterium]|jgi:tRNA(fMet)-specific endonuclease VapC|nr:PIN domain-containing protein [Spirochaetota bacterium]
MAVEIAVDANRYRDFVDGREDAVSVFRSASRIHVPFVVTGELRAGFAVGTRGKENEHVFESFLRKERVDVLHSTMATTRQYAGLYRQLRAAGNSIPSNDLWIAGLVIEHNLYLFSRDTHFDALPQLPRI